MRDHAYKVLGKETSEARRLQRQGIQMREHVTSVHSEETLQAREAKMRKHVQSVHSEECRDFSVGPVHMKRSKLKVLFLDKFTW